MTRISAACAASLMALVGAPTLAADITNNDAEAVTLIITENGVRSNVVVAAGETLSLCGSGCFLTAPNGDRAALQGDETVSITGGGARVE